MKILVIAPTPFFADRGCHVRIYEEAKALLKLGHQIKIVTYHLGKNPEGLDIQRIISIPWYHKLSAGPAWHKFYLDILLFFKLCQINRVFKADIIHAHLHEGCFLAFFLKKIYKIPIVFDLQGSLSGELVDHGFIKNKGFRYKIFYYLEKKIDHWADHILVSSGIMQKQLISDFKVSPGYITIVNDGISGEREKNIFLQDNQRLADKLSLPKNKKIIVYLGHLSKYQGIDILIEAVQILIAERQDFYFLMLGYPEEKYKEKIKKLGLDDYFNFVGRINYQEINDYLSLGQIAISPKLSLVESNGKLYNYMACSLPVIAFDSQVNREILGENGFYVSQINSNTLAEKLKEILSFDDIGLIKIGDNLKTRVWQKFDWQILILKIDEVYKKLIDIQI